MENTPENSEREGATDMPNEEIRGTHKFLEKFCANVKKAGFKIEFKSTEEEPIEFPSEIPFKLNYNPFALMTYELYSSKIGDEQPRFYIVKGRANGKPFQFSSPQTENKPGELSVVGARFNVGRSKIALDFPEREE